MRIMALFTTILFTSLVFSEEPDDYGGFICVPDFANGYAIDRSGKWRPAQFDINGRRHLLKHTNGQWFWTKFGEEPDDRIDLCSPFNEHGFTKCENREDEVLFNRKTFRYQVVRPYGYVVSDVVADRAHRSTPFYEIGRCSPL